MKVLLVVVSLSTIVFFGARSKPPKTNNTTKVATPFCRFFSTNGVYTFVCSDGRPILTGDPHHDMNEPFYEIKSGP